MKTCPRCNRTYPDSENFCEADSSPLVSEPAFTRQEQPRECPVCGGKAEPGEIICNFCGARLDQSQAGAPPPPPPQSRTVATPPKTPSPYPRLSSSPTSTQPPSTAKMSAPIEPDEGRSTLGFDRVYHGGDHRARGGCLVCDSFERGQKRGGCRRPVAGRHRFAGSCRGWPDRDRSPMRFRCKFPAPRRPRRIAVPTSSAKPSMIIVVPSLIPTTTRSPPIRSSPMGC